MSKDVVHSQSDVERLYKDAFDRYMMCRRVSLEQISKDSGVDLHDLKYWIRRDKWREHRTKFRRALIAEKRRQMDEFISEQRIVTADRHLRIARDMEDFIRAKLDWYRKERKNKPPTEGELLNLSKALKNASDVAARASGLTDQPHQDDGVGTRSVLVVGLQPVKITGPVVDVPCSEM